MTDLTKNILFAVFLTEFVMMFIINAFFESTADLNRRWQEKLAGTIWANYMLISTQWRGANKSPLFEHGEVPRYLVNVTMETFIQDDLKGTCLGCHAEATTKTGRHSDFTFLLRHAQ